MRKCLMASAVLVAAVMMAPVVSAGPGGGWGKGLLSETLEFCVGESNVPDGFMYWSPETGDFIYDFHGYYLDVGVVYYLIAFEGDPSVAPDDYVLLGAREACDLNGVHIKGIISPWPGLLAATVCLVPNSYEGFGGDEGWMPSTYQLAGPVDLVGPV